MQIDKCPHWKYAGEMGYPLSGFGKPGFVTNYDRAACLIAGLQLPYKSPWGYRLIEDSFKRIAKAKWADISSNLSHSHSGWLDLILVIGLPGFFCIVLSLLCNIY